MRIDRRAFFLAAPFAGLAMAMPAVAQSADRGNMVYLFTKNGRVTIRLRPDLAPHSVAQIKTLVKQGFYNGLSFHRVIAGFMAQTGDPTGTGSGGSKLPDLKAEFTPTPYRRGTIGLARTDDPDSANSQFFICFAAAPFLDGKYTVIGEVIAGMEIVDKIKKGDPRTGALTNPDKIVRMQLASQAN